MTGCIGGCGGESRINSRTPPGHPKARHSAAASVSNDNGAAPVANRATASDSLPPSSGVMESRGRARLPSGKYRSTETASKPPATTMGQPVRSTSRCRTAARADQSCPCWSAHIPARARTSPWSAMRSPRPRPVRTRLAGSGTLGPTCRPSPSTASPSRRRPAGWFPAVPGHAGACPMTGPQTPPPRTRPSRMALAPMPSAAAPQPATGRAPGPAPEPAGVSMQSPAHFSGQRRTLQHSRNQGAN